MSIAWICLGEVNPGSTHRSRVEGSIPSGLFRDNRVRPTSTAGKSDLVLETSRTGLREGVLAYVIHRAELSGQRPGTGRAPLGSNPWHVVGLLDR